MRSRQSGVPAERHLACGREEADGVSKPKGPDYVLITPITQVPTGTNSHEYDPDAGTVDVNRPTQQSVQIDCCGGKSEAWAKTGCCS